MKSETVLFNEYHEGQYWLGLKHPLKNKIQQKAHFLPIEVKEGSKIH